MFDLELAVEVEERESRDLKALIKSNDPHYGRWGKIRNYLLDY